MKIVLQGLQTLSQDLSKLVQSNGKMDSIECVGDMDKHGKTNAKLGKLCRESNRYMYNESGNFVCSQCCTDHYWSRLDKQCKKCGECSTRKEPNVWMDCTPTACKISTTPRRTSTNPVTVTKSTTTTEQFPTAAGTTKSTTPSEPPITKPNASPQNYELVARHNTSIIMKWSEISRASYEIEIRDVNGGYYRYILSNTTSVTVSGLIQGNYYETAVRARNSAGDGPWSPSVSVRTLGTEPRRSPKNVEVALKNDILAVTWDGTSKIEVGAEEPLKGYKVKLLLNNIIDRIQHAEVEQTSLDILLSKYGSYTIFVYYFNNIGDGPPVEKTVEFHIENSKNWSGVAVFFGVVFIILLIIVFSSLRVFEALENRFDKKYLPAPSNSDPHSPENGDNDD